MNISFEFKALRKLVIFRYAGFEFTVSDKWLHKIEEEKKNKTRKQAPIRQQPFKKWCVGHQQKLHTQCVAFGESVLQS